MYAAYKGDAETVKLLIKKGVDLSYESNGKTALKIAKEKNQNQIAKILESAGAR